MNGFDNDAVYSAAGASYGVRLKNKFQFSRGLVAAGVALLTASTFSLQAAEEGIALAIVYDTSGSMREAVRDKDGKSAAKFLIANRALTAIAKQIQSFATNSAGETRRIEAGLWIFNTPGAREAVKFGTFDAAAIERWAGSFDAPGGNTPLGNALSTASQAVLRSPLSRKHVLVITDGISNTGPAPAAVMSRLKEQAAQKHEQLSVHFVAFDVDAKVFEPVKKLGATVVGALDEKQLNSQLSFILQKKILLEEEEKK